jgi:hypothetical protein
MLGNVFVNETWSFKLAFVFFLICIPSSVQIFPALGRVENSSSAVEEEEEEEEEGGEGRKEARSRMAEKKSAYEMMMERARAGAKGKGGRPPASSSLKAKEAAVTLARKEEEAAAAAKDSSTEAGKTAAGIVVLSVADRVALLSKKETEFDPQMAAFWKPGEHVPFIFLASAFDSKLISSVVEAFPLLSLSLCILPFSVLIAVKP